MRKPILILIALIAVAQLHALPPEVQRAQEINKAIHSRFDYEASPWTIKRPGQTIIDGAGDCADGAALLIELLEAEGIPAVMGVVIIKAFTASHAVVVMSSDPRLKEVADFSKLTDTYILDTTTGEVYSSIFMRSHLVVFTLSYERLLSNWSK